MIPSPRRRSRVLLALALMLGTVAAAATVAGGATRTRDARARLTTTIGADLRRHPSIPGEAVSVRGPGLDVAVARGDADVGAHTPLRVDTPFRIASVTKTFVAVAVLRLVEQGVVELDAPIARYLSPESNATLHRGGYDPDVITVHQLLDHTSGLFDYASSDAYDAVNTSDPGHRWTRAEQLDFAVDRGARLSVHPARSTTTPTPATCCSVSSSNARPVTRSPTRCARRSASIGSGSITRGGSSSRSRRPGPSRVRTSTTTRRSTTPRSTLSADLFGGGGLVSTVGDVSRFFQALFDGQVFEHDATLDSMLTVSGPGRRAGAALGIFRWTVAGVRCWGHPGYWGTVAASCPARHLSYALTTNQADEDAIDTGPLERTIVRLTRH